MSVHVYRANGNAPPSDNRNDRPAEYSDGTTDDVSACAIPQIDDYIENL